MAVDQTAARRLQDGDPGGEPRRALAACPVSAVAERALARYFRPGGRPPGAPYTPVPRLALRQSPRAQELAILANFVEVWLAKEGHRGPVGVNYLERPPPRRHTAPCWPGWTTCWSGPVSRASSRSCWTGWPGHQSVGLPVEVGGAADGSHAVDLDPRALLGDDLPSLARPARAGSRTNPAEWSAREALHWLLPERPGPRR